MKKIIILCIPFLLLGCFKYHIEDNYKAFHGTAVITKIKDSVYNPGGENKYSDIFFNFSLDKKDLIAKYRFQKWKDNNVQLSFNSRMNHYKPWIKKMKIAVGKKYKAIRYEKRSGMGSSSPVVFKVFLDKEIN